MCNEEFRILKHDLLSDLGSIFAALKVVSSNNDLQDSKEVLELIVNKESNIMKNLGSLLEEASVGGTSD